MKSKLSEAKLAAITVFESVMPPKSADPKCDSRWLMIQNLHQLNTETYERAKRAEYEASLVRMAALNAYCSSQVTRELLAEQLGIELESEGGSDNE